MPLRSVQRILAEPVPTLDDVRADRRADAPRLGRPVKVDAAFFHLEGLNRNDTAYMFNTFPIVRTNDEKGHGEYRTRRVFS